MRHKIPLRQKIAVVVSAGIDILMLVLAGVLDTLRSDIRATYFIDESGNVTSTHIFDNFGYVVAVALAVVTIMFAMSLVNIISSEAKDKSVRVTGFSVLFVVSVVAVMFSYLWVRGDKPISSVTYSFTDSNARLILFEEDYSDDFGTLSVFVTNEEHSEIELLAVTDIHRLSESSEDYCIDWIIDGMLRITFLDGDNYHTIQLDLWSLLDEEELTHYLGEDMAQSIKSARSEG